MVSFYIASAWKNVMPRDEDATKRIPCNGSSSSGENSG